MTDHTDTVVLEDEYLDAALELRSIAIQKKDLEEREAEAKRILMKALDVGDRGVSADGEELATVRRGSLRFNADRAAENLPAAVLESIQVTVADSKKAKSILAPALYELCCTYTKPSVVAL